MLCSRAITREEAAMSGSIAAFVFTGFFACEFLLDRSLSRTVGTYPTSFPCGRRNGRGTDNASPPLTSN